MCIRVARFKPNASWLTALLNLIPMNCRYTAVVSGSIVRNVCEGYDRVHNNIVFSTFVTNLIPVVERSSYVSRTPMWHESGVGHGRQNVPLQKHLCNSQPLLAAQALPILLCQVIVRWSSLALKQPILC